MSCHKFHGKVNYFGITFERQTLELAEDEEEKIKKKVGETGAVDFESTDKFGGTKIF